jgi:type VII secretion-associated serine protease mycosin
MAAALVGAGAACMPSVPATADEIRDAQWHLDFLEIARVHQITRGDGIVVAVIDTGVDATHPDLRGRVLPGTDLTLVGKGGNGQKDEDGHGTGMAGLIAAQGRALGIAPAARILPVRDTSNHFGFDSHLSEGLEWAIDHGARVVCIAAAGDDSSDLRLAIERALRNDIVIVAGVGNYPASTTVRYPAAYRGVVAAGGIDRNGRHADVSVTGREVVLAAPAVDIMSTGRRGPEFNGYRIGTGTSDATAIIAGAAALVRARYPDLSAAEVVHRLTATADDKGISGHDHQYGYGVVNLVRALTADVPPLPTSKPPPTTSTPHAAPPSQPIDVPWLLVISALAFITTLALLAATYLRARRP